MVVVVNLLLLLLLLLLLWLKEQFPPTQRTYQLIAQGVSNAVEWPNYELNLN